MMFYSIQTFSYLNAILWVDVAVENVCMYVRMLCTHVYMYVHMF